MIALSGEALRSGSAAFSQEWLETNGRGGYALGTAGGGNFRRYHGLLSIPAHPPVGRVQALNRLEETLLTPEGAVPLSCQSYAGAPFSPPPALVEFRLDPFPIWIFESRGVRLKKTFFLRYGEDTAVVLYTLLSGSGASLSVRPLLSGRDHHSLGGDAGRFDGRWSGGVHGFQMELPGTGSLHGAGGEFQPDPVWYHGQEYGEELRRGFPGHEDVFSPGIFRWSLAVENPAALVFSTKPVQAAQALEWADHEVRQRRDLSRESPLRGPLGRALTASADSFLAARGDGLTVIAGFPWFEDWGRDAMISLPGLCLATGRPEDARKILDVWLPFLAGTGLPNRFNEGGLPEGSAPDAALWAVWAVQQYHRATRDEVSLRRWMPALRSFIGAVEKGDRHGVHMDRDGLVYLPPGLTWMDARVDGSPVTPRGGKPVEIQALWYNALAFLAEIDLKWKEPSRGYDKLAAIARGSFNEKFWNEEGPYLYDRLDGRDKDASIRPNALFALSLPYEILDASRFKAVVDFAAKELLTPWGLRTLSPRDPAYRGRYDGGPARRDGAYHQGTAWPWLLGAFVTAHAKATGSSDGGKHRMADLLSVLSSHALGAGLGFLPELADGDAPRRPGGCPAQAWSVAEILRVLWEENIPL